MRADDPEKKPHNFSISPTNQVINTYFGGIGFAAIASQQERRIFTMVREILLFFHEKTKLPATCLKALSTGS